MTDDLPTYVNWYSTKLLILPNKIACSNVTRNDLFPQMMFPGQSGVSACAGGK